MPDFNRYNNYKAALTDEEGITILFYGDLGDLGEECIIKTILY